MGNNVAQIPSESRIVRIVSYIWLAVCVCLPVVFSIEQYREFKSPLIINLEHYQQVPAGKESFKVENINKIETSLYNINGWAYFSGKEAKTFNTLVVLYEQRDSKGLAFKTKMSLRPDVTAAAGDGKNYDASGFRVTVPTRFVKNKKTKIALLVQSGKNQKIIFTNQIVEGGGDR
ncbi:hypothetical protein [Lacticaseibacillus daqingensis]|uniref:hypothetical protein n=1 Tax=Lacticaseibacillus daqingensis TaxID=2486014 RepID=UPI000F7B72A0|nr:hypothetical protein [Lacticaseibacillus daqingensis]